MTTPHDSPERKTRNKKNVLEWSVFAASSVLVTAFVIYLVWQSAVMGNRPADIRIVTSEPVETSGGWKVPVSVTNEGDRVATSVRITITADVAGVAREASFTFDAIPRNATREGSVMFSEAKTPVKVIRSVAGYEEA